MSRSKWVVLCACLALAGLAGEAHGAVFTVYSNSPAPGDFVTNPGAPAPTNVSVPVGSSGWSYNNVRVGGTIGINNTYPHLGNGSVFMQSVNSGAKADIELVGVLGTLGDLTSLAYSFYRDGSSTVAEHLHPVLRLLYDADGNTNTTNDRGYLIYEQIYNGGSAVPTDVWLNPKVIAGNLWMTHFGNPNGSILEIYDRDLVEWQTTPNPNPAYPTLSPSTLILGIGAGIGSGWNGTFVGAIDNIAIGFGSTGLAEFNFEVATAPVPEPATLALWSVLAATAGIVQFRRRRK